MTRLPSPVRPPWLPSWLADLFSPADAAESILGDLSEEFSEIAASSGIRSARRWYWRECARSVAHLAGAAFRVRPGWLVVPVLLGFLFLWFGEGLPEWFVVTLLRTQTPYSNRHIDAYVAFLNSGIPIARVLESLVIGTFVAVLAKGKEMVATLTLTVIHSVPIPWFLFRIYVLMAPDSRTFHLALVFFLLSRSLDLIGIVVAGVLVRKLRSPSSRPLAVT